jgi:hypothetical protein
MMLAALRWRLDKQAALPRKFSAELTFRNKVNSAFNQFAFFLAVSGRAANLSRVCFVDTYLECGGRFGPIACQLEDTAHAVGDRPLTRPPEPVLGVVLIKLLQCRQDLVVAAKTLLWWCS